MKQKQKNRPLKKHEKTTHKSDFGSQKGGAGVNNEPGFGALLLSWAAQGAKGIPQPPPRPSQIPLASNFCYFSYVSDAFWSS